MLTDTAEGVKYVIFKFYSLYISTIFQIFPQDTIITFIFGKLSFKSRPNII